MDPTGGCKRSDRGAKGDEEEPGEKKDIARKAPGCLQPGRLLDRGSVEESS